MKVFFFTPFIPPQPQAAAVRCYWLIRTLKQAGHTVEVFSSMETPESKALYISPADNKKSFARRLFFEFLTGLELFLRILFSKADVYVLSSPPFVTISIAHLGARIKGAKYLLDIRDIYPEIFFAQGLIKEDSLAGRVAKGFTSWMYKGAEVVATVTPSLVNKIKSSSPESKNVFLLLNGYDKDLFLPSSEKFSKFTVIFHGNMGKIQDLPTILKVAELLSVHEDIEFLFVGGGPQEELLLKTKLKNVRYLGTKPYDEIPALIARAHIGFSARRSDEIGTDALPVKAFEYLGVGLPVILTPKTGVMTQFSKNGVLEFDNTEINAIAQKILELKSAYPKVALDQDISRQESSKLLLRYL